MKNAIKYKFTDFTLDNYQRLLLLAKEKYVFCNYLNFNNRPNEIIWRHDVEFSTKIALEIAKSEAEVGVSAIYFVNIHSEFYSVFEKESFQEIMEIVKLGHEIGLHFDCHFYNINNKQELVNNLEREKVFLEDWFNKKLIS